MSIARRFKAGQVHPATWWLLAAALATSSAAITSTLSLLILMVMIVTTILLAREAAPWSQSLRFYLFTGILVIAVRVLFRIIFNFDSADGVALNLPPFNINLGGLGEVQLFGRVSFTTLSSAVRDGFRMAAVILSVGLANSLANPRRLLKHTPGALYEVATAIVIAINMAPQLIASAKRVRSARDLRGRSRRQNLLTGLLIPVIEDTLESSLALAATMDARGFGRSGTMSKMQISVARLANFSAICFITTGSYLLLCGTGTLLAATCFGLGLASLGAALRISSLKHIKTRYQRSQLRFQDLVLLAIAAIIVALSLSGVLR
jgi:energy-coupling factor transport system permease protein